MYQSCLALLALASCSYSRPAQSDLFPPSLASLERQFSGFPAEYLPNQANTATGDDGDLSLPLWPKGHPEIKPQINAKPGIPPRGIELIISIAIRIHEYWSNTANLPIRNMIDDSRPPFKYIHFFTRPSSLPRAVFNPLKGGITLVWVLRRCFLSEFWPGSIKAVVWDLSLKGTPTSVAFLEIKNVPNSLSLPSSNPNTTDDNTLGEPSMVVNTTAPLQSANNVSLQLLPSDASFRIPPHVEKRWLACWSQLFLHVMQFSPERYVKDGVDPTPDPQKTSVFHYSCDVMSFMPTRDKINLELLPTFGRVIRPYMTYGEVAGALLAWITRVADTPDGWRRPQSVFDGNMFVEEGSLSITLSAT